ncbi:hypothetical protein, partial [Burkholderia contaminans]|uniref:hypothetical protein n=1 Tax=Burkholderia contaminans TaxID=488447 RepID=UPI001C723009
TARAAAARLHRDDRKIRRPQNSAQPRRHCVSPISHRFAANTPFRPETMHYQRYGKAHRKCIWSDEIGLIRCIHCISAVNHAGAASSRRHGGYR